MKKYALAFTILFIGLVAAAQNPHLDFKYAVKLSNETGFSYVARIRDSAGNVIGGGSSISLFHLTPSLLMRNKNSNFTELSLQSIGLTFSGSRRTVTNGQYLRYSGGLSVGLAHYYTFGKQKQQPLVFSLGWKVIASEAFGQGNQITSNSPLTLEAMRYNNFSAKAYIAPRLTWYMSDRFFLDATANLPVGSIDFNHRKIIFPSPGQIRTVSNSIRFTNRLDLGLQIGAGIKF